MEAAVFRLDSILLLWSEVGLMFQQNDNFGELNNVRKEVMKLDRLIEMFARLQNNGKGICCRLKTERHHD